MLPASGEAARRFLAVDMPLPRKHAAPIRLPGLAAEAEGASCRSEDWRRFGLDGNLPRRQSLRHRTRRPAGDDTLRATFNKVTGGSTILSTNRRSMP